MTDEEYELRRKLIPSLRVIDFLIIAVLLFGLIINITWPNWFINLLLFVLWSSSVGYSIRIEKMRERRYLKKKRKREQQKEI